MAVLKVLTIPNKILITPTAKLTENDQIDSLIEDMIETMYHEKGIGLAANQVGYSFSLFVMDVDGSGAKVFINPEIISEEDEQEISEGCLSIPGAFMQNNRYENVRVGYYNRNWEYTEDTFNGREAHCIQHEVDHLSGKLFIDSFGPMKKQIAMRKYNKFKKAKSRGQIRML